jgi:hypothetical protein
MTDLMKLADETTVPGVPPAMFATPTLAVRPWVDELIDTLGFDPRSSYVERFWLPILGPSTTWLLRRVSTAFDRAPEGFQLPLADTARELGLGDKGGRHSPFLRALFRSCQFDMARVVESTLEVRRRLPPLNRRQLQRLPESLAAEHRAWQEAQLRVPAGEATRRRAQALALTLLEMDPDASAAEQRLTSWALHPAVAHEAIRWAWDRHRAAAAAAGDAGSGSPAPQTPPPAA